jgi:hypothetical protein
VPAPGRPGQRVGERQPEPAERQQDRDDEEADADADLERGAPVTPAALLGRRDRGGGIGALDRQQPPGEQVGDDAEAAGERRRAEDDAQQQRVDVQALAEPLAHAGDHAVVRVAAQVAQGRRAAGGGHRHVAHSRLVSPVASRTAPTTANAMGAMEPKLRSIVSVRSSSSTMPNAASTQPATSSNRSGRSRLTT